MVCLTCGQEPVDGVQEQSVVQNTVRLVPHLRGPTCLLFIVSPICGQQIHSMVYVLQNNLIYKNNSCEINAIIYSSLPVLESGMGVKLKKKKG